MPFMNCQKTDLEYLKHRLVFDVRTLGQMSSVCAYPIQCVDGPVFVKVAPMPHSRASKDANGMSAHSLDNIIHDAISHKLLEIVDSDHAWTVKFLGLNSCRKVTETTVKVKKPNKGDHVAISMTLAEGAEVAHSEVGGINTRDLMTALHTFTKQLALAGHRFGFVHNDMHASNVFLTQQPVPRFVVIDYGRIGYDTAFVEQNQGCFSDILKFSKKCRLDEYLEHVRLHNFGYESVAWLGSVMIFTFGIYARVYDSLELNSEHIVKFHRSRTGLYTIRPTFVDVDDLMEQIEAFDDSLRAMLPMLVVLSVYLKGALMLDEDFVSSELLTRAFTMTHTGRNVLRHLLKTDLFAYHIGAIRMAFRLANLENVFEELLLPVFQPANLQTGGSSDDLAEHIMSETLHIENPSSTSNAFIPRDQFANPVMENFGKHPTYIEHPDGTMMHGGALWTTNGILCLCVITVVLGVIPR